MTHRDERTIHFANYKLKLLLNETVIQLAILSKNLSQFYIESRVWSIIALLVWFESKKMTFDLTFDIPF